ncbi:MAG: PAS domain S-box protein [Victivallales bacterium]
MKNRSQTDSAAAARAKKEEENLRRMATVVRDSSDAITLQDFEGRITAWNRGAELMYGYSEEEALQMNIGCLRSPSKVEEQKDFIRRLKAGETITSFETQRVTKDGRILDVWMTVTKLMDDSGKPVGLASTERDITARKKTEAALQQSETRLSNILDSTPFPVAMVNVQDTTIEFWSSNAITLFGHTAPTTQEWYQMAYPDPDYRREVIERWKSVLEKARLSATPVNTGEYRIACRDGSVRICELYATFLADKLIVTFNDITERKWAEAYRGMSLEILQIFTEPGDLKDSIQRVITALKTRTGFDAVGIRLKDGDDFPYFAQQGFSKDFLQTENTLLGRTADGGGCRDKDGNVGVECTCGLVISGKTDPANPLFTTGGSFWTNDSSPLLDLPSDQDPRLHPRNQCIRQGYASVALVPIRNKDGIAGLIQFNDRRKRCFTLNTVEILEGIASHLGAGLMRRQEAAERETLEAKFNQSQKMESVGLLAGGVAHDFNNMLAVINGYSQMLLMKLPNSDPDYSLIQEINKAGERSADLTRQLLAFASKQAITPKVLDLNNTIASMLKLLRRLIGENIKLLWEPASDLWKVKMDPSQLDQILANLLVNTRDAISGNGKVIIDTSNVELDEAFCRMHPNSVPGKYVVLSVSDDGCGMSKETCGRIFEPFFTTKKAGKGTGLGLATVFGIVKQNNGFINIDSEPGKGTTFKIYLPRHESENAEKDGKHEAPDILTGTETVLLVEDEFAILIFAKLLLERLGYTVLDADSPAKAINLAGEYKGDIHLMMTDVVMPEMSGRDLKEKISSMRPGIKSLFMSGYTSDIIANKGVLDKGIHFIQKPFTAEGLSTKLREALS